MTVVESQGNQSFSALFSENTIVAIRGKTYECKKVEICSLTFIVDNVVIPETFENSDHRRPADAFVIAAGKIANISANAMSICFENNIESLSLDGPCTLKIRGDVTSSVNLRSGSVFSNHARIVSTESGNVTDVVSSAAGTYSPISFHPLPHIIIRRNVLVANMKNCHVEIIGSVSSVSAIHAYISILGTTSILQTFDADVTVQSLSVVESESGHIVLATAKAASSEFGIVNVDNLPFQKRLRNRCIVSDQNTGNVVLGQKSEELITSSGTPVTTRNQPVELITETKNVTQETRIAFQCSTHDFVNVSIPKLYPAVQFFQSFHHDKNYCSGGQPTFRAFSKWDVGSRAIVFKHNIKTAYWGPGDMCEVGERIDGFDVTEFLKNMGSNIFFGNGYGIGSLFYELTQQRTTGCTLQIEFDITDQQNTLFFENWVQMKFIYFGYKKLADEKSYGYNGYYNKCLQERFDVNDMFQTQRLTVPVPNHGFHAVFKGLPGNPLYEVTYFHGQILF